MKWVVLDKFEEGIGKSPSTHAHKQSSNTFFEKYFEPEFDILPEIPENV